MAFALCHLLRPAKLNWSPETETCFFSELATWIAEHLRVESAVLDGEIACIDDAGRSVFRDLLFRRRQCVFIAFDLLHFNGKDLRVLPLIERKPAHDGVIDISVGVNMLKECKTESEAPFPKVPFWGERGTLLCEQLLPQVFQAAH